LGTYSQTGYQRTCTPSLEASHCNENWPLLRYELAKTSWSSSKDMDTADWRRNNSQLETDVAECRGAWTSWRVIGMDHSRLRVMMIMIIILISRENILGLWWTLLHRHYLFDFKFMFIGHCIYESSRFLVKTGSVCLFVMDDDER